MAVTARGLIGTGSATTAGTTITVTNTTGAVIPAGTFIHITGCWDNINSVTAPTITCSTVGGGTATANHGTAIGSGVTTTAGSGIWHQCFRVLTTSTIASGATVATLTSNQSAVKRCAHAEGFDNCTTTLRGTVTTATSGAGTPTVTTTGTALVIGDLVIGSASAENNAQMTADADTAGGSWPPIVGTFTTGGAAGTNVVSSSQYKILTATGTQTFNPTGGVLDTVACVYSVVPVPDPTFTQAAYRLYADGTETGSTALAAQDTAPEVDVSGGDVNVQLRVRVQSTNAGALAATDDYQLHCDLNASGTWTNVAAPAEHLADSYPSSNWESNTTLSSLDYRVCQSFLGNGEKLNRAAFYILKVGSPTPDLTSTLYTHSGTFGTNSVPNFTQQSSTAVAATSVTTSLSMISFTFAGTWTLVNGTPYVIGFRTGLSGTIDGSNYFQAGRDFSSPTHAGNFSSQATANSAMDLIFEVYTTPIPGAVVPYGSSSLTDGAVTTNRLGAGTGSFSAGEVSEDGLVDDLLWTANNYTELLYSITLKQADLADADTLTFRVVRNGATTGFTYTATPTVTIQVGAANITGTALISASVATTVTGVPTTYGTAAVSSSATVTAAGARTGTGTAAIAETVTVTASGTSSVPGVTVYGTALISATDSVTVTGKRTVRGTVALTEAATVTVVGVKTVRGTVAITESATTTVTGVKTVRGTVTITQTATTTVTGKRTVRGTVAISESVTTTALGSTAGQAIGTALISAPITITVSGRRTVRGTVAIAATATTTVTGTRVVRGTVLRSESATVTVVGTRQVRGTVVVSEAATVTVVGTVTRVGGGTALISAAATVTVVGKRTTRGTVAIAEQVAVTAVGAITSTTVHGTATITASATTTVAGRRTVRGVALLTSSATTTVAGRRTTYGQVLIGVQVTVTGLVITYYDDRFPHTGSWTLTYTATYALEYVGSVDRRYSATWDCDVPSATWDIDHSATWELV